MVLEKLPLFVSAFIFRGAPDDSGRLLQRHRRGHHPFFKNPIQHRPSPRGILAFLDHGLRLDFRSAGAIRLSIQRIKPLLRGSPCLPVKNRLKDGAQAKIILLGHRIIPVIMALSTVDGQSQQRGANNLQRVRHDLIAGQIRIRRTVRRAIRRHAQKTRRH